MKLFSRVAAAAILAVGRLPITVRIFMGRTLGYVAALIPHRERTIAVLQLRRFLPATTPRPSLFKLYAQIGQTALEALNLRPLISQRAEIVDFPSDFFEQMKEEDRGIVALSAHMANWELLGALLVDEGLDVTLVAREARSDLAQHLAERIRADYGAQVIWRVDGSGTRQIIRNLREKRFIGALIDQDTDVSSVSSRFFGAHAKTPSSLIALAQRYNAALISIFIVRVSRRRFRVSVRRLDPSLAVEQILAQYHSHLEEIITAHPEQWAWVHKRWRTNEQGVTLSTRDYLQFLKEGLS